MSEILTVEVEDYEGIKKLYEFCELTRDPQNHLMTSKDIADKNQEHM